MSLARFVVPSALLLALFSMLACSDDTPKPTAEDLPTHVSIQVGTKGGTLKASGMTLEIPEGALDKNVKISATNAGQTAPKEVQAKQVSDLYEFGPEGTKFNKDVKIVFHTAKEEQRAEVYFTTEDGSAFEKIKSQKSGTEITAFVKHFSQGFVGIPLDDELDAGDESDAGAEPDAAPEDAEQDAASIDDMDAGSTATPDADTLPGLDASEAGPAKDAGGAPSDAGTTVDAALPSKHIVVHSRDSYGVLVNQTWAAFQDGQGAWQQVLPSPQAGVYEFDIVGSNFGVAFVCASPDTVNSWGTLSFEPASSATLDVITHGTSCTAGAAPAIANLQGTLDLFPDLNWRMGHSLLTSGIAYSGAPADFSTNLNRNQVTDLLFASGPANPAMTINRLLVKRDVTLNANTTGFNETMDAGVAPQGTAQAQVLNATANSSVDVHYTTRGTEDGLWLNTTATSGTTTRAASFATVPNGVRLGADRYLLLGAESNANDWRKASFSTYPTGNLSVALPPTFTTVFSALKTPYLRPTFNFTPISGATLYTFSADYSPLRTSSHSFMIEVDPAWLSGSGNQTLTFPDLSQVPGFQMVWVAPASGSVSAQSAVQIAKSDASGDLKTESGQSATVTAP
jgi:hypothetical protein